MNDLALLLSTTIIPAVVDHEFQFPFVVELVIRHEARHGER